MNVSLSHYNFSLFTAAPGDRVEHGVAEMSVEGGLSDEGDALRTVPVAGHGRTLVFADINTDDGEPSGVYRVLGKRVEQLAGTRRAFAVAVAGSRIALARLIPAGCICNSEPAWSQDGQRIAFVSGRAGDGSQLFVMNADGAGLRKVIDDTAEFAWSPDGASFAVEKQERVVVVKSDGSAVRTIGRERCMCEREFAWSPDGSRLAYLAGTGERHLFVVPAAGGSAVDLGEATEGASPRWSPNSRRIAYTRSSGEGDRLFVAAPAGGTPVDLGLGVEPEWAPDGSAIAVQRQDGTYAVAPDGSGSRRLGPDGAISPDWKWIAYGTASPDDQNLWIVPTGGGPPRELVQNHRGRLAWSPDSRTIAYHESSANTVHVIDVDSGVHRVTAPGLACFPPTWSPDSSRLVCVASSDPDFSFEGEVAVVDARTGRTATVTKTEAEPERMVVEAHAAAGKLQSSFDAPQGLRGLAWGGSRFALLIARSKTQATVEIRSARGKLLRSVNVPRPRFDELSMSGRWVVFQASKSVRLLDAATGRTAVLAQARKASIVGLSIDGRRVAWAESSSKRSRIRAVVLSAG